MSVHAGARGYEPIRPGHAFGTALDAVRIKAVVGPMSTRMFEFESGSYNGRELRQWLNQWSG